MEDKDPLHHFPNGSYVFGFEGLFLLLWRRIFFHPVEKGIDLWWDLIFSLRDTSITEDAVFIMGEPTHRRDRPSTLFAPLKIRENPAELEEPGFKIGACEVQVSSGFERLERQEEQPEQRIVFRPEREKFLGQLGEITQREWSVKVVLYVKKGFDKITITHSDQFSVFFLVIENIDVGHGLQAASEPVPEFPRTFCDSLEDADIFGKEDDDLILFTDIKGSQNDGFWLFAGH